MPTSVMKTYFDMLEGVPKITAIDIQQEIKGGKLFHYITIENGCQSIVLSSTDLDMFELLHAKLAQYLYREEQVGQ